MPIGNQAASPLRQLYKQLEKKMEELSEYRDRNRRVFTTLSELEESCEILETRIKDLVRGLYDGKKSGVYIDYKGGSFNVQVAAKWERVIDVDGLLNAAPLLRDIEGVVQTVINKKKLDSLIEGGKVDAELVKQFVTRKQVTSAVSFVNPKKDEDN